MCKPNLSILIPAYNYDVQPLLLSLAVCAFPHGIDSIDIIIADDGSAPPLVIDTASITALQPCFNIRLIKPSKNIGRAAIRNFLVDNVNTPNILFIDADSEIVSEDYLEKYFINSSPDVVIAGGTTYQPWQNKSGTTLRYIYGIEREATNASQRNNIPYGRISFNNLWLPLAVFNSIRFNDQHKLYGHEDTIFGHQLKKLKVEILHIDNQVLHTGIEYSKQFLAKVKEACFSLSIALKSKVLPVASSLSYAAVLANSMGIASLILFFLKYFLPTIENNLLSPKPKIRLLDIFKFYWLTYYLKENINRP